MATVEEMLITLEGFGGSGFTFLDLISNVIGIGGLLASLGAFAAMKSYILSLGASIQPGPKQFSSMEAWRQGRTPPSLANSFVIGTAVINTHRNFPRHPHGRDAGRLPGDWHARPGGGGARQGGGGAVF
jgi:hypothetical protein